MPAQKRDLKPITVYLEDELIRELKRAAKAGHISVSAVIRRELHRPRVEGHDRPRA